MLAGAGVVAAVAAGGGIATAAKAADAPAADWDHECDVLCVGSGPAVTFGCIAGRHAVSA